MLVQTINHSYQPKTKVYSSFKNEPKIRNGYTTTQRTYRYHNNGKAQGGVKRAAALGGVLGAVIPAFIFAKRQKTNIFNVHYNMSRILGVSTSAILGGTFAGILADKKENAKPKVKEGVFQLLNATIPLLTIPPIKEFMKNTPKLNNVPCKILGMGAGIFGGMVVAADLANRINDPKDLEPDRKLNYKDALANIDDAMGAVILAKVPVIKELPLEPVLPAVYAWCGFRAGQTN